MPYYRKPPTMSRLDMIVMDAGTPVPLTPPKDADVGQMYVQLMMSILGIPHLTLATASELYRRVLIWHSVDPLPEGLNMLALIDKHMGMKIEAPPLSRGAFHAKARRHLWISAINNAHRESDQIEFIEK